MFHHVVNRVLRLRLSKIVSCRLPHLTRTSLWNTNIVLDFLAENNFQDNSNCKMVDGTKVHVCVCVCVCVCHNEKRVPDEWQARQAIPATLQVSSSNHNANKNDFFTASCPQLSKVSSAANRFDKSFVIAESCLFFFCPSLSYLCMWCWYVDGAYLKTRSKS